jgi:multicomponent Na+:H+ antiporter subunit B
MDHAVDMALLFLLSVTALVALRMRSLFAVVMLTGIYSLLCACLWVVMDAVDVAFTEAAVGAGISTVLFLGTLALVGRDEKPPKHGRLLPLLAVFVTGAILFYASLDLPYYGRADNPINLHVAPRYVQKTGTEIGVPNIVTATLASYRGYDTMGETTVIFTAGIAVLMLLSRRRRRPSGPGEGDA